MPFYIKQLNKHLYIFAILHFMLGILISSRKDLATFWGLVVLFYGLLNVIRYKNKNDEASIFAGYLVGMEVVLRGVGASVFWEYGKYSTILILFIGMVVENVKYLKINTLSVIYFVSLLPAIVLLPDVSFYIARQMISANLSGPLCLFFSVLYFRRRIFNEINISNVFKSLMLPIISLLGLILVRAPAIQDLEFSSEANFQMSAGFGPNQVSTLLGVSLILVLLSRMLNIKIFPKPVYDYIFLTICIGFALLTFARGGVIAPFIAGIFAYFFSGGIKNKIQYTSIIYVFIVLLGLYYFASNFTKGMLDTRYAALLGVIDPTQSILVGRTKIMTIDIQIFRDNFWMGVGPGAAHHLRWIYGYDSAVGSHSEFTRMLAEHGLFGLISLFSLLILSYREYRIRIDHDKIILGCMSIFSILTMFHSAFRIALPGFIYGLSYVLLNLQKK